MATARGTVLDQPELRGYIRRVLWERQSCYTGKSAHPVDFTGSILRLPIKKSARSLNRMCGERWQQKKGRAGKNGSAGDKYP
jgi:hypothetical protein